MEDIVEFAILVAIACLLIYAIVSAGKHGDPPHNQ